MKIQDFCDMNKFEQIMSNWAKSTGLATVAVGSDGKYISDCYNFTEFCIDLTRGCPEGKKRCEKCDREGHGVYPCHAGLVDFGIPITLDDGTVLGSIIGGQVLPEHPDENKFRATARELGIDEDKYIAALQKVNVKTSEEIHASADLLGDVINMFVRASYTSYQNSHILSELKTGISNAAEQLQTANDKVNRLMVLVNVRIYSLLTHLLKLQELAIPEEVSLLLLLKSRSLQKVWARQAMISKKLLTKSHRLLPLWIKNKKYSDVNLR